MRHYLLNRLIRTIVMLIGLSVVVFLLLSAAGDPAMVLSSQGTSAEQLQRLRRDLGLDQPLPVRYAIYIGHVLSGDFGRSWKYGQPSIGLIMDRIPATVELAVAATLLSLVIGGALGILGATHRRSWLDVLSVGASVVVRAMPTFWLGLMLIFLFAVNLGWLPTSGRGTPLHLILPATTLAALFMGDILLLVRSSLLDVLDDEYIRTARSKGLRERRIVLVHALRNAALPVVSVASVTFAQLIGGSVVIEAVFSWPGVGLLAVDGVSLRDFSLVQASVFVLALGIAGVSLLTDVTYAFLDPRIRRT